MHVGAVFPQTEIESDAGAIKRYAQEVERMGFTHILAYDHVVGANTASRPDWRGPYTLASSFLEPLSLFAYLAAVTDRVGLVTGIIILPQRQTVLVAKQAACIDVLANGRLRLGVGTGWNEVEYEALGMSFADRGQRYEDQINVLRALWTEPAVSVRTPWHKISDAGIKPLPVQRPIPIWMGGGIPVARRAAPVPEYVMRRIARLADGWIPLCEPDDRGRGYIATFHAYCREYGRDPRSIGLEGTLQARRASEGTWADTVKAWRESGASHLCVNTMNDGLHGADAHLRRLEEFRRIASLK